MSKKNHDTARGWSVGTLRRGIEIHDKGASWPKTLEAMGIEKHKFNSFKSACLDLIRKNKEAESMLSGKVEGDAPEVGDVVEVETDLDAGTVDLFTLSPRIETPEQAIEKANIDTAIWEPSTVAVKSWEMGCKVETVDAKGRKITRGVAVTPLFAVTVKLKRKSGWAVEEFRAKLCEDLAERAPQEFPPPAWAGSKKPDNHLAEVAIPDHHFGKLAWRPETGNNYDLDIAEETYINAASDLINRSMRFLPSRWLYIVGNDLLHVDLGSNTTTAGTRQDCDGRWQKSYLVARRSVCQAAEKMRETAPVDILIVPGNHDEEKLFCLGDSIESYFRSDKHITVDNSPAKKKFYKFGVNLLGFQHGHKNRQGKHGLPLDMASEVPDLWAQTTWREIHCGHFHSEKEEVWHFKRSESIGEVIVRYLPSLCGTDVWHKDAGYRGLQASECHIYNKNEGRAGYVSVRPRTN